MVDWVQVIPLTTEGQFVMVEQFRPGPEVITLEFPAGLVDAGESPLATAARELREETGYEASNIHELGALYPNPAIQSNLLHILFAEDCRRVGEPQQDEGEDVHVRLIAAPEVPRLIANGTIKHALVLSAWQLYESWRVQRSASRT
jgi:8-oxo-dGTP pyrophosphatase MutT (NUDIX family)